LKADQAVDPSLSRRQKRRTPPSTAMSLLDFHPRPPEAVVLVGDDLVLRPARTDDYAAWADLRAKSQTHLAPWEPVWNPDDLTPQAFRLRLKAQRLDLRAGTGLPLLVFRRNGGALIGGVSLTRIRFGISRSAGVGYWIGAPFIRKGYGKKALSAVLSHAFLTLELNRVEAACQAENVASQRLLLAVGFEREGVAKDYLKINGVWRDHLLFAMTARRFAETSRS
jgi:ribosomal-protein-alanine N-acetyltransferase